MIIKSIYYCEPNNYFIDDDGNIFFNIFDIITPSMLFLFKKKRGTFYIRSKIFNDVMYEFVFPLEDDEPFYDFGLSY